jgi:PBP1b-binding outer membrane lipoprotein LpoB
MKKTAAACAVLALVMAGCASAPQEQQGAMAEVAASNYNTAGQDGHQMTGSRLKDRNSTDRMLKAIGGQGVRDEMNKAPRPLNSSGGTGG